MTFKLPKSAREIRGIVQVRDFIAERLTASGGNEAFAATRFFDREDRVMVCTRSSYTPPLINPAEDFKRMAETKGLPWQDSYQGRAHPVWASDQRVNRYGDIDLQNWNFTNYDVNPVILLSHQWDALPIGASIDHQVMQRSDAGYNGPALRQIMLFATPEISQIADSVNRLWAARFLRTVSTGFFPGKVIDVEDPKERADLGLGKWGMLFDDNELVELSPCSVPALPSAHNSALRDATKPGDVALITELMRKEIQGTDQERRWKEVEQSIRRTWRTIHPDAKVREHPEVNSPVEFEVTVPDKVEQERIETMAAELASLKAKLEASEIEVKRLKDEKAQASRNVLSQIDRALASVKSSLHKGA